MRLVLIALVVALAALVARPAKAGCLNDVQALAEAHGVTSKPPVAVPDSKDGPPVTTQDLARSGGVIAPPPMADNSVIKPPVNADPGMKTSPDKPLPEAAADTGALQTALTAARNAAEHGDEQACRESLAKAKQLARSSG